MIIVQLKDGLGNQMFQYALYRKFKTIYSDCEREVKLDRITHYESNYAVDEYSLNCYNIEANWATREESEKLGDFAGDIYNRIRRKIMGRRNGFVKEQSMNYDNEILTLTNAYLSGYWQTEKYFLDIREVLLKDFGLKNPLDVRNSMMLEKIKMCMSVAVHVRRGDYYSPRYVQKFGNICDKSYFERALRYFEEKYEDVVFFFFSDDIDWVKKELSCNHKGVVVDLNGREEAYKDIFLMSSCKHNIISNSSFSWWGAWLNENNGQEVVAPTRWLNNIDCEDIYCNNWRRM